VLVLGGSGFIGSHVADALADAGHRVTIFDRKTSPWLRPDQTLRQGDLLDRALVAEVMRDQEAVYNFAGLASIDHGAKNPIETVEHNVLATVITLEAARKAGVRRYVYASTVYVYSGAGAFYRCSKQAAELYIEEYQTFHGLDYTILRFGTTYGPRADDGNSVRRYLTQALRARRISVAPATGDEMREYIHVRDAARSCVTILAPEFKNQHIVLTGHNPMRFRDLLHMIREIVGPDVTIELKATPDEKLPPGQASVHYALTPYSYRPRVAHKLVNNPYLDLGQGLLECLEEIDHDSESSGK
jgi:UDP-glucose 4-epimerase